MPYIQFNWTDTLVTGVSGTFGESKNHSDMFVGGLPSSYWSRMRSLTVPSAMFLPRFNGYIRNVLYGNCSCTTVRAGLPLDGDGYVSLPATDDSCDSPGVRHNCTRRCLCLGTDQGPTCDCSDVGCNGGMWLTVSSIQSVSSLVCFLPSWSIGLVEL